MKPYNRCLLGWSTETSSSEHVVENLNKSQWKICKTSLEKGLGISWCLLPGGPSVARLQYRFYIKRVKKVENLNSENRSAYATVGGRRQDVSDWVVLSGRLRFTTSVVVQHNVWWCAASRNIRHTTRPSDISRRRAFHASGRAPRVPPAPHVTVSSSNYVLFLFVNLENKKEKIVHPREVRNDVPVGRNILQNFGVR